MPSFFTSKMEAGVAIRQPCKLVRVRDREVVRGFESLPKGAAFDPLYTASFSELLNETYHISAGVAVDEELPLNAWVLNRVVGVVSLLV